MSEEEQTTAQVDFTVPTAYATFELVEKKSRFIGEIWQVHSEEEAKEKVEAAGKKYHDASHHCWCYRINQRELRCSDDGEPQGTAGQPMLGVFEGEKVEQVCCVVTRYFGGTELGTGGLRRAYSHTAKGALLASGRSTYLLMQECSIIVPYPQFETVQREVEAQGGTILSTDYGVDIELVVSIPLNKKETFGLEVVNKTAGQVLVEELEEKRMLQVCLPPEK